MVLFQILGHTILISLVHLIHFQFGLEIHLRQDFVFVVVKVYGKWSIISLILKAPAETHLTEMVTGNWAHLMRSIKSCNLVTAWNHYIIANSCFHSNTIIMMLQKTNNRFEASSLFFFCSHTSDANKFRTPWKSFNFPFSFLDHVWKRLRSITNYSRRKLNHFEKSAINLLKRCQKCSYYKYLRYAWRLP